MTYFLGFVIFISALALGLTLFNLKVTSDLLTAVRDIEEKMRQAAFEEFLSQTQGGSKEKRIAREMHYTL